MAHRYTNAKKSTKTVKGTRCPMCDITVSRVADLPRHMKIHSPFRDELMLRCPWKGCEYATLQNSNLKTHINSRHTRAKKIHCQVSDCTKFFTDPSAAIRHRKRIHKMSPRAFREYCELRDREAGCEFKLLSNPPVPELDFTGLISFDSDSNTQDGLIDVNMNAYESTTTLNETQYNTYSAPDMCAPAQTAAINPTDVATFNAAWSQDSQTSYLQHRYNGDSAVVCDNTMIPTNANYQLSSCYPTGFTHGNTDYITFQYSEPVDSTQFEGPSYGYQSNMFECSAQSYPFMQPQQPQLDFDFDIPAPVSTMMPEGDFSFDSEEVEHYLTLEYLRQQQRQPSQWPIC